MDKNQFKKELHIENLIVGIIEAENILVKESSDVFKTLINKFCEEHVFEPNIMEEKTKQAIRNILRHGKYKPTVKKEAKILSKKIKAAYKKLEPKLEKEIKKAIAQKKKKTKTKPKSSPKKQTKKTTRKTTPKKKTKKQSTKSKTKK